MKKWYICVPVASLVILLVLMFGVLKSPVAEYNVSEPFSSTNTNMTSINPLEWINSGAPPAVQNHEKGPQVVVPMETIMHSLFTERNISIDEKQSLQTWDLLKYLVQNSRVLPNAIDAIKEAGVAWNNLMASVDEERLASVNKSSPRRGKEKQCPHYLSNMNATVLDNDGFKLRVPCGLTQGSSVTIIGIPSGLLGNFKIDLAGEPLPGEPDPPIILHYNVRLLGDKITEEPVIVQNTWTAARDWGEEERCPSPSPEQIKKDPVMDFSHLVEEIYPHFYSFCYSLLGYTIIPSVSMTAHLYLSVDELDKCNKLVGKDFNRSTTARHSSGSRKELTVSEGSTLSTYFPFKQGYLSVATLRVGTEGIQMTVDGKHITSFAFRETLEPWLINEVRISGDLDSVSVVASNLPTSEDSEHIIDLESLIAPTLPSNKSLELFIGVFSTANNFKRRMAVRRTWMQYDAVRSGAVAVRFFVGLHKNQMVNEELWNEAHTYKDIQLMPFVDYYSLITWKTVAICIFGTEVVSAKFVMKTDDDAFVRVDEVLSALKRINVDHGLLYGLINSDSRPHRNPDSKWFISHEEWAEDKYPPWAHGPGYVVSNDIAKETYKRHKNGQLKMFKLEDVAMGIWIDDMKKGGLEVKYEMDERIHNEGCKNDYVVAHYQGPREMLCLWQKLQEEKRPFCCG